MNFIQRLDATQHACTFCLGVLVTSACCALDSNLQAAPVTLQFEAIVGPPNTVSPFDVPFNMPFEFHQGDIMHGSFTFEPVDVSPSVSRTELIETLGVTIQIATQTLHSLDYGIVVRNDALEIDGPDGRFDEIRLNCGPFAGNNPICNPNTIPGRDDILWGFNMALGGTTSVLTGADIPGEPSTWNGLESWHFLSMSFRERNGPGIRRLTATVGDFVIVPESTTITLVLIVLIRTVIGRYRDSIG